MTTARSRQAAPAPAYTYQAYGLTIRSDLALPELIAASAATADITIRRGAITRPSGMVRSGERCLWATPTEACLFWADAGTILVRDGGEMIVEPVARADEQTLRIYLLGPALGVLLQQRGLLVLHASAAAIGQHVVAFVGESGGGKSTTAAALHARGHAVLADDVAALLLREAAPPLIFPAIPRLKLDAAPAAALGYPPTALSRFDADDERLAYRVDKQFSSAPLALSRIYVLADGSAVTIERCRPQESFVELLRHSYALRIIGDQGATAAHFQLCAQAAKQVPVYRLSRPHALAALPDMVQRLEAEATSNTSR
ncbi:MAG TPA: hypothetical protein VFZ66_26535 [Herpetosiphonaceae bacterium]